MSDDFLDMISKIKTKFKKIMRLQLYNFFQRKRNCAQYKELTYHKRKNTYKLCFNEGVNVENI